MNKFSLHLLLSVLSIATLLTQSQVSAASDSKLIFTCRGEQATGFNGRSGNGWVPTTFNNNNSRYFISQVEDNGYSQYELMDNEAIAKHFTVGDRVKVAETDYWIVFRNDNTLTKFTLNRKTLKFTSVSMSGFINNQPSQTPYLEIGSCTAN